MSAAMELGTPDQVPVQCQMATGHILLNSGVDPIGEATDTAVYAESLLADGASSTTSTASSCTNRAANPAGSTTARTGDCPDGWEFVFPEGCYVRVQRDDDPIFFPAGLRWPRSRRSIRLIHCMAISRWLPEVARIQGDARLPPSKTSPSTGTAASTTCGTSLRDRYSLHGETRAPFDHVLNLLSVENMMMALLTDRTRYIN